MRDVINDIKVIEEDLENVEKVYNNIIYIFENFEKKCD